MTEATAAPATALGLWLSRSAALLIVGGVLMSPQSAFAQEAGKELFQQRCAACHTIGAGRLAGPDLVGVNDRRTEEWLLRFVKASQAMVKSGDATATALFQEFNQIAMPDQDLSDAQIRQLLAYIRETGDGAAAGSAIAAETAEAVAPAAVEPAPEEILLGQNLFEGRVRLANGGPACNSCHHVMNDAVIGGGILAKDLTQVFSRMGQQGVSAILGGSPFPVMKDAYQGRDITETESRALVAFLQNADRQHAFQKPSDYGWRMFIGGAIGVVVLLALFGLVGRNRKRMSVNQAIYDRQIRSE